MILLKVKNLAPPPLFIMTAIVSILILKATFINDTGKSMTVGNKVTVTSDTQKKRIMTAPSTENVQITVALEDITSTPIFSSSRTVYIHKKPHAALPKIVKTLPPETQEPSYSFPEIQYLGAFSSQNRNMALVKVDKTEQWLTQGDSLGDWKLKSVYSKHIIFRHRNIEKIVPLSEN